MTPDIFDSDSHVCFGCHKVITDYEPHIHLGLDEFGQQNELDALGMDDLFSFTLCMNCTEKSDRGWIPENHAIARDA